MEDLRKIMLIRPWDYKDINNKNPNTSSRTTPLNLLYLASQLNTNGIPFRLIDLIPVLIKAKGELNECFSIIRNTLYDFKPDVIGISFFTYQIPDVIHILEFCKEEIAKKINCNVKFIAGGVHATAEPLLTLQTMNFDFVFVGEAEIGLVKIGKGFPYNQIKGVASLEWGLNGVGEQIQDLDSLPPIDLELCDSNFLLSSMVHKDFPAEKILDVMIGRGCVYRCGFCAYHSFSNVRFHSVEYIIKYIISMRELYNIDAVVFIDSSIGNNRKLLVELCKQIKNKINSNFKWYASIRANQVNEEILSIMWNAGCRCLFYGFESGSQKVLELMNKGCTVEQNRRAVEIHKKLEFPCVGSMMIGYPGETEEDIKLTIKFIKENPFPNYGVNWFVPLPGSDSYKRIHGKIENSIDEWRSIGEIVPSKKIYTKIKLARFKQLYLYSNSLCTVHSTNYTKFHHLLLWTRHLLLWLRYKSHI